MSHPEGLQKASSVLFKPIKVLGMIIDDLPLTHSKLGTDNFFVASVGRSFQVFDDKFRLTYISPHFSTSIRAITDHQGFVFTAFEKDIVMWKKMKEVGRYTGHKRTSKVLHVLGHNLISLNDEEALVFDIQNHSLHGSLELEPGFCPSTICHPPTLLNKVLIGSSNGELQLWNVSTLKKIHSFSCLRTRGGVCITSMEPSPVLDVIAVGYADGVISMIDIKKDKVLFTFKQTSSVSCLCFRSLRNDESDESSLISGGENGEIVIWNLAERKLQGVIEGAHNSGVTALHQLPGEPCFASSGKDNGVAMWLFEKEKVIPRELRNRRGLPGIVNLISPYGESSVESITASNFSFQDVDGSQKMAGCVGKVSFIQSAQNLKYSMKALEKNISGFNFNFRQLPTVTSISHSYARHYDWAAVVTTHEKMHHAFVWSAHQKALQPAILQKKRDTVAVACSADVSICGNFAIVGYSDGTVQTYFLQNQHLKKALTRPIQGDKTPSRAHSGPVSAVSMAIPSMWLTASKSDRFICVWDSRTGALKSTIPVASPVERFVVGGALVGCALTDGSVSILDVHAGATVRDFAPGSKKCPHDGSPANSILFSPDLRWFAASFESSKTLEVYDLLTGLRVDWIKFESPLRAMCFDASTTFLYTSHDHTKAGISVWCNQHLFEVGGGIPNGVQNDLLQEPIDVAQPGASGLSMMDEDAPELKQEDDDEKANQNEIERSTANRFNETPLPLKEGMLTLSGRTAGQLQALVLLEEIKERNKLKSSTAKSKNAPFFLPTRTNLGSEGGKLVFDVDMDDYKNQKENDAINDSTNVMKNGKRKKSSADEEDRTHKNETSNIKAIETTAFQRHLSTGEWADAWNHIRNMSPSLLHLTIQQLGSKAGAVTAAAAAKELARALKMFAFAVSTRLDADLVQAILSVFLQLHEDELLGGTNIEQQIVVDALVMLNKELQPVSSEIGDSLDKLTCFLKYLSGVVHDA